MNTFMRELKEATNIAFTTNEATAYKSTLSAVYDLFAFGGAYRRKSDEDCRILFQKAYEEDKDLALKCLFYLRDIRGGGQGERRFFRVCFNWLAKNDPRVAANLLPQASEYCRWDDVIYSAADSPLKERAFQICRDQLRLDDSCKGAVSLCAKWMPSINASSEQTKALANELRRYMKLTQKEYRQLLSRLRKKINVLERLMSAGKWDEIDFSKIPSKAGLKYRNAFARRDIIKEKYKSFVQDNSKTVNADTLYPYDIVRSALNWRGDKVDLAAINKYWQNQKDYLEGKPCKMICVCDTSGSMWGTPMNVAIGLSLYCAERIGGPFKNRYISFASRPQLIETVGEDFVEKVLRIYNTNLCDNTNLEATFRLLKETCLRANPEDRPETVVVISDMQIDEMTGESFWGTGGGKQWTMDTAEAEMDIIMKDWIASGLEPVNLVYWNVNAANPTILQKPNSRVSFVSGCSPTLFKQIMTGKQGVDLMLEALLNDRYAPITAA